jgi:predicted TIM-barrel fold metal-dependent hydrolase
MATDYPHIDSHFPHALEEFLEIDGLSQTNRRKILWDNCARLYRIS